MAAAVTEYVLKVHSRCDLACDHCYVYEHADQSWRTRPRVIAETTVARAAGRIAEHAAAHGLPAVRVVLHGGEPLLLGVAGLRRVVAELRERIEPTTRLDLRIHTNGIRLNEEFCALFTEHGVKVGVSLDGDRVSNDRHRRFPDGRSSHARVRRALALLRRPEYRHLYAGILCTIDLRNDPIAVYEALLAEAPPRLDLLLPHATWEDPPSRPPDAAATAYADWLARIHSRWVADGRPVAIRLFDSISSAARGGPSRSESIGLDPVGLAVIETDGAWEQADSLKTAFDGAPATGLTVFDHSVDELVAHRGVAARRGGIGALCAQCRSCPVVRVCGGGLYAHRYSRHGGFDNPSVYCLDLKALIGHITAADARSISGDLRESGPPGRSPGASDRGRHRLSPDSFDAFAAGPGDTAGLASLAAMRLSLTRALVARVAATMPSTAVVVGRSASAERELLRAAQAGWALLRELDTACPEPVAEILSYPYVAAWAVRCLRPPPGADTAADLAHLAGLAAAAALRAGVPAELRLPVRAGRVHLPATGAIEVDPAGDATVPVRVEGAAGAVTPHGSAGTWSPVWRLDDEGLRIVLDDLDPFRDCQDWPAADRLSGLAQSVWRRELVAGWNELAARLPGYAEVLRAGLRAVVPLRPDAAGHGRSATARYAFGGVALALPATTEGAASRGWSAGRPYGGQDDLAVLLVHEFQHVKLAALLDLHEFLDSRAAPRLTVPWRPDPRPVEGALHGAYAHLAIGELWRARARDAADPEPAVRFRRYRDWVDPVIDGLMETGALAADGERFVAGMRAAVDRWAADR